MICVETEYFNVNRILLLSIGLWPYQKSKLVPLQFILVIGIMTTTIIVQFTTFLTSRCTSDLIIKILSTTCSFIVFITKYIAFRVNIDIMKDLLAQLQHIYNHLRDKNEYAIVEKYGHIAKRYTVILTVMGIFAITVLIVSQYWTNILDIVLPINESRPLHMQIITEYFIDQQKYFSLIILHITAACCLGITIIIATGTMLIAFIQHFCGMFRIASYRIERMMKISILENNNPKKKNLIFDEITCAVDIHRQAMKLTELLSSNFEVMICCLVAIGVISLSLNLFRISQIASSESNVKEIIWPFMLSAASIIYMFVANFIGQDIIDHNNYIFSTVYLFIKNRRYNVQWYIAPLNTQRIILFLLTRGTKEYAVCIGGLFMASLDYFATLVKASVSYFTFIHSARS